MLDMQTKLKQANLLIVGDIMLDKYLFGEVERISPEAPVPIVKMQKTEDRLGAAANVARNTVSIGVKTSLVGMVGDDDAGIILQSMIEKSNIISHVFTDPMVVTTIKQRILARGQQLLRLDFESYMPIAAANKILPIFKSILNFKSYIKNYSAIILSDYNKGSLVGAADIIKIASAINRQNTSVPILVDPKGIDYSIYKNATVITPNCNELALVLGAWRNEEDLSMRAQNLRTQLNLKAILLTRGAEGVSLYTENEILHFPAKVSEVLDVSGAGDTVVAILAACMAIGLPLCQAAFYANCAAGIVVKKLGTATVNYEELFGEDAAILPSKHYLGAVNKSSPSGVALLV